MRDRGEEVKKRERRKEGRRERERDRERNRKYLGKEDHTYS